MKSKRQKNQNLYLLEEMSKLGWTPGTANKTLYVTSPCKRIKIWIKPRVLRVSYDNSDSIPICMLSGWHDGDYEGVDLAELTQEGLKQYDLSSG
jgi:hypothetical protein